MALIKCSECGKDVSEQAEVCIHCGFPIKKNQINRNRQNIANKSIGFEYFSEKGDTLALTCKNCKKIWNFSKEHIIDNTDESGNNYLILETQLVCPNCSNRMSIGEKIKVPERVEVNTPPIDDISRAAATSFHGASGIWYSLRKLPPTGSNIKNGVLTAYPFCRRNGSTPLTRTRGSNSKPLKSLCTAPTFPKW